MALGSTIGAFLLPFRDQPNARTPQRVEALQTSGNGATSGMYLIGSSATASGDTYLVGLNVCVNTATSTSQIDIMFDEVTIGVCPKAGATNPSAALGVHTFYFGDLGLKGGTTTTNSVYLNIKNATAAVVWTARFNRLA